MRGLDECIIIAETRQADVEELPDGVARDAAEIYADEDMPAAWAFVNTGEISDPDVVWRDIFDGVYWGLPMGERVLADMLGTYLTRKGARGPVPGWSDHE